MPATISGRVFDDLNHNGIFDVGEPGISNTFVVLRRPNGTCISTQTAANGTYSFTNINTAGTYTLYETVSDPGASCPPTTFTQPSGFNGSTTQREITFSVSTAQINNNANIVNNFGHDSSTPFGCTPFAWQVAIPSGDPGSSLFRIDLQTGTSTNLGPVTPTSSLNAIGYNDLDGYIYGYNNSTRRVTRLSSDGLVVDLPPVLNLPNAGFVVGDVNPDGYLYLSNANSTIFYVIDVTPNRGTYGKLVDPTNGFQEETTAPFGTTLTLPVGGSDWAFNPTDGQLYTISNSTGIVSRINPLTGIGMNLTTINPVTGGFGGAFFDRNNNLYGLENNTGEVYRYAISGNTATRTLFSNSIITSINDGARCNTSPITFAFFDPIEKRVAQSNVGVGDTITYTIILNNIGNTTANDVTITDTVPNGTSFIPGSLTVNGNLVPGDPNPPGVNIGDLGVGLSTITFSVLVDTIPSPNPAQNNASIAFTYIDGPNGPTFSDGGNTNTVSTTVNFAILHMTKSVDIDFADIGDTLTYTIVLTNTGNTTANNIVFIDTIPSDTTFVTNSLTQDGLSIIGSNPNPPGATLPNSIGVGGTSTITFQVTIDTIPSPNPIPNTSTTTFDFIGDSSIPTIKNGNSDSNFAETQVNHANLENILKAVDRDFADCGDTLTYTISVPNVGNITALNVIYTDTIPSGTNFIINSVTVNGVIQPGVNPQTGVNLGNIGPGASSTITFQVVVDCS